MHRGRYVASFVAAVVGLIASVPLALNSLQVNVSHPAGNVRGLGGVPFVVMLAAGFACLLILSLAVFLPSGRLQRTLATVRKVFHLGLMLLASYLIVRLIAEGRVSCLLCWTAYLPPLLIALVDGEAPAPVSANSVPAKRMFLSQFGPTVLALLVLTGYVVFLRSAANTAEKGPQGTLSAEDGNAQPKEFRRWFDARPLTSATEMPGNPMIVKFHDYQCPPCKAAHFRLDESIKAHVKAGATQKTLDFPLDSECNSGVTGDLHPLACELAALARTVR